MKNIIQFSCLIIFSSKLFCQTANPADDGRKIKIPVVFHIIYSNSSQNIPDSMVLNELNDLNKDFSAQNNMAVLLNDFKSLVANVNIEFYLYDTTLQATGIKGVDRIQSSRRLNRDKYLINPVNCVNVFIAYQGNASGILSDRVNLNFKDVGKHIHVLTHETGHWLGLYHIWGQSGNSA